jgi:hypothetical protein
METVTGPKNRRRRQPIRDLMLHAHVEFEERAAMTA